MDLQLNLESKERCSMSQIKYHPDLSNIKDLDMYIKYSSQAINQIHDILEGRVDFDINIASQTLSVTFTAINTVQLINHGMNRTGLKYFVVDKSVACDVYHTASRDTVSQIALSCTVATTVTIILI